MYQLKRWDFSYCPLPTSLASPFSVLSPSRSELCFMDLLLVLEQIRVLSNLRFFMCSSLNHSPPAHPILLNYSVQFSRSVVSDSLLSHGLQHASPDGLPVHHQLLEFIQAHTHWVSDAIQLSHPLLSLSPPAFIFPSIRVFSNESVLRMRWPKFWSFSFSISPSNEHPGLISFRMDSLDLRAVQV